MSEFPNHPDRDKGIIQKYRIERTDGKQPDPNAKYFVLRYDSKSSKAARKALRTYAEEISLDFPELAKDLNNQLDKLGE